VVEAQVEFVADDTGAVTHLLLLQQGPVQMKGVRT
jgi:hypothetical protein